MAQIFVVEDDKDIRDSITEVLESEGYSVESAANGKDALERLRAPGHENPRVILLDLMMPVMSGMEFRKVQLADPLLSGIPLIVMSADNRAVQKSQEMQSAVCILKPLEIDELLGALQKLGV